MTTLAEARAVIAQAEAEEKDKAREKLSGVVKELQKKNRLKLKVDAAVSRLLAWHQMQNDAIQQILAMINEHHANKPAHMDVLPSCDCKACVAWRKAYGVLERSREKNAEMKRNGTGDPLADTTLQRNLANEIMTLQRAAANLEARLRDRPVGAQRFEGGLYGVR